MIKEYMKILVFGSTDWYISLKRVCQNFKNEEIAFH